MDSRRIYEDENLVVIHQPGKLTNAAIITFSELLMRPRPKNKIWAGKPIGKLGYPAIGFVAKSPNWFPKSSVEAAAQAVLPIVQGFDYRLGYGFSMGAWAVLKYARMFGLDACLSFSPQFSIDPTVCHDPRFSKYYDDTTNRDMAITAECGAKLNVVCYDPKSPNDKRHVDRLKSVLPIQGVALPYLGHGTVRCVTSTRIVGEIFSHMISGDVEKTATVLRASRKSARQRPLAVALAVSKRSPVSAYRIYQAHKKNVRDREKPNFLVRMQGTALQSDALSEMLALEDGQSDNPQYLSCLASLLNSDGQRDAAMKRIETAIEIRDLPKFRKIKKAIEG